MKHRFIICILSLMMLGQSTLAAENEAAETPLRVAITTGGHDFDRTTFFGAFDAIPGMIYNEFEYPKAAEIFTADKRKEFDVFACYDMYGEISDETTQCWLDMLKEGKGLVVLHHAIASFPKWPEYVNVIGAKYFLEPQEFQGKQHATSTYKHDIWMDVTVVAKDHPVVKGMNDFKIYDEAYGNHWVSPDVTVLLKTDHAESQGPVAWIHTYEKSRVVYIQLGHGPEAHTNPNFVTLLKNALYWTAHRTPPQ